MEIFIKIATLLLATCSLVLSLAAVVLFLKAVRVHDVPRETHGAPQAAVDGLDVDVIHVYGRTSGVDADRARDEIERTARLDTAWLNALIKRNLGTAARDLVADVYETADRDCDLAHIHNADGRGPDMTVFIRKGVPLVKVGADEFRFVVPPVPADLPGGDKGADAGEGNGGQFVKKDEGSSGTPSDKTEKPTCYTEEHREKIGQTGD